MTGHCCQIKRVANVGPNFRPPSGCAASDQLVKLVKFPPFRPYAVYPRANGPNALKFTNFTTSCGWSDQAASEERGQQRDAISMLVMVSLFGDSPARTAR